MLNAGFRNYPSAVGGPLSRNPQSKKNKNVEAGFRQAAVTVTQRDCTQPKIEQNFKENEGPSHYGRDIDDDIDSR